MSILSDIKRLLYLYILYIYTRIIVRVIEMGQADVKKKKKKSEKIEPICF